MRFWWSKPKSVPSSLLSSEKQPSERLVEQRVRNRIMEEFWGLSRGDLGVTEAGPTEWFECFFDHFPYEGEPDYYPAMTLEETEAVREVCKLMQQAIADSSIPKSPSVEDVCRSGWPQRIAPVAKHALDLMLRRGRFSEEVEETKPSSPIPWPSI
jgi:hypothetical protein